MKKEIIKTYKVVRIISDSEIIINAGKKDDVRFWDKIHVIGNGEKIYDPETNELLGEIAVVKGKLRITDVYEKFSICKSESMDSTSLAIQAALASMNIFGRQSLNVDETQVSGYVNEEASKIRIGDEVEIIGQGLDDATESKED